MEILVQILKLLAGIGLFLFAMYLLETSLKNLSGRRFKRFLHRISKTKIGAVTGGAIATGLLQSSSMVSLMVLAFVGTGVFTMRSAFAIILGTNLGTTLDSWLVVFFGFKLNIEIISYPAVFAGGIMLMLFGKRKSLKYLAYFLLGFGLLFISIPFIRTAMETELREFDLSNYAHMSLAVFLLIGFIITVVVQSSSVTMVLTLSALHAGVIEFTPAAAIVLGSETGTTIKVLLTAIGGNASKKRVVFGNLIVNLTMTVIVFILLRPIIALIVDVFGIKDPMIGLVTFSTLINLMIILVFLPFLNLFARLLEKLFKDSDGSAAVFIERASIEDTEASLDLFRRETGYFIYNSMLFNLSLFEIEISAVQNNAEHDELNRKKGFLTKTTEEKYEFMKQWQGEIQLFYLKLRKKAQGEQSNDLNQLISAVRNSLYSVKGINDISGNIFELKRSSKDIKYEFFMRHKEAIGKLYNQLLGYLENPTKGSYSELQYMFNDTRNKYTSGLNDFYKEAQQKHIEDLDMTTVINFNRELFSSNKAILLAVKDFLLDEKEAKDFD